MEVQNYTVGVVIFTAVVDSGNYYLSLVKNMATSTMHCYYWEHNIKGGLLGWDLGLFCLIFGSPWFWTNLSVVWLSWSKPHQTVIGGSICLKYSHKTQEPEKTKFSLKNIAKTVL